MRILINPSRQKAAEVLRRPESAGADLQGLVAEIFADVANSGDAALFAYGQQFDKVALDSLLVSKTEMEAAAGQLTDELKSAIQIAASNIRMFHEAQRTTEPIIETTPGVVCWRKSVPVQSVGLYIPGGSAPLFSTVLMLAIPAAIAGCSERILCTPPQNDGSVNPAILFAAQIAGIVKIFKAGGAQAIAAMTLGTQSIPKVDKLFGPGNSYVTAAKQYAQSKGVAIDLPAGPSEVLVVADDSIPAGFVAADLLAQAEHGPDSQVVFVTDSAAYAKQVRDALDVQLPLLPRAEIAGKALENSVCIVCQPSEWIELINQYAPEHLIVAGKYEDSVVDGTVNAGSVFIGPYSAESFGDYASGTNHTLPTAGYARAYSGVSLDSFVKKITYQRISKEGLLALGPVVMEMAKAESLEGHSQAIEQRLITITTVSAAAEPRSKKAGK